MRRNRPRAAPSRSAQRPRASPTRSAQRSAPARSALAHRSAPARIARSALAHRPRAALSAQRPRASLSARAQRPRASPAAPARKRPRASARAHRPLAAPARIARSARAQRSASSAAGRPMLKIHSARSVKSLGQQLAGSIRVLIRFRGCTYASSDTFDARGSFRPQLLKSIIGGSRCPRVCKLICACMACCAWARGLGLA
jgi:hypothetical protein